MIDPAPLSRLLYTPTWYDPWDPSSRQPLEYEPFMNPDAEARNQRRAEIARIN